MDAPNHPEAQTAEHPWFAHVLTLYPDMFPGPLGHSLAGKGLEQGIWALKTVDIRAFAPDKHRTVDGPPAGGGPGMVLRADIVAEALDFTLNECQTLWHKDSEADIQTASPPVLYLSPRGRRMDQALANRLAAGPGVILICGRFEGIDQRLLEARPIEEVSVADLVLSGGEPAALVLLDAVVRLLPGIVGAPEALREESFANGLLEYPQYTKPFSWENRQVPEILRSGHHAEIRAWRQAQSEALTKARRPDLWDRYTGRRQARGLRDESA